jgi:hypothetical protein
MGESLVVDPDSGGSRRFKSENHPSGNGSPGTVVLVGDGELSRDGAVERQ